MTPWICSGIVVKITQAMPSAKESSRKSPEASGEVPAASTAQHYRHGESWRQPPANRSNTASHVHLFARPPHSKVQGRVLFLRDHRETEADMEKSSDPRENNKTENKHERTQVPLTQDHAQSSSLYSRPDSTY